MPFHSVGPDYSHRCRVLVERANSHEKTSREACGVLGDQRLSLQGARCEVHGMTEMPGS